MSGPKVSIKTPFGDHVLEGKLGAFAIAIDENQDYVGCHLATISPWHCVRAAMSMLEHTADCYRDSGMRDAESMLRDLVVKFQEMADIKPPDTRVELDIDLSGHEVN